MSEHKSDLAAEGQEWKSNAEHVEVLNTPTDESSSSNADSEQYHFTWGKFAACLVSTSLQERWGHQILIRS